MKMKISFPKIKDYVTGALGIAAVIFLIAFVNEKSHIKRCRGLVVNLDQQDGQYYLTAKDIESFVTDEGVNALDGKIFEDINLAKLEKKTMQLKQIKHVEAYGDLLGRVHLDVVPYIPFARISGSSIPDCYIDEEGTYFPLSKYHSARVIVLSGSYFNAKPKLDSDKNKGILELIKQIKVDDFWNAQIAQIDIARSGEIKLVPVLGDQIIEFGHTENVASKLEKLKVFYKQILPVKGWDQFSKVKVQYKNQIVCE